MAGTGIMTSIYSSTSPSSYPIEKNGDSLYPYPVNTGTGSDNTHEDRFIYHIYLSVLNSSPYYVQLNVITL